MTTQLPDITTCIQAGLDQPVACLAFLATELLGWTPARFIRRFRGKSLRHIRDVLVRELARSRRLSIHSINRMFVPLDEWLASVAPPPAPRPTTAIPAAKRGSILETGELLIDVFVPPLEEEVILQRWRALLHAALVSDLNRTDHRNMVNQFIAPRLPWLQRFIAGYFKGPPDHWEEVLQETLLDAWKTFSPGRKLSAKKLRRLARNASDRIRQRLNRRRRKTLPHGSADWAFLDDAEALTHYVEPWASRVFLEGRMLGKVEAVNILVWRAIRTLDRNVWEILAAIGMKLLGLAEGDVHRLWKGATLSKVAADVDAELRRTRPLPVEEINALMNDLRLRLASPDPKDSSRAKLGGRRLAHYVRHCPEWPRSRCIGAHVHYLMLQACAETRKRNWKLLASWRSDD